MLIDVAIAKHISIGDVPPTPIDSSYKIATHHKSIFALHFAANVFGTLVGYAQEQNGELVHNVMPIPQQALNQISSSSEVALALHTELAFHPYKPDYVVLLCLRGDPAALTTYAILTELLEELSDETISVLHQQWYTTTIDLSFILNGATDRKIPTSVLNTIDGITTLTYDEALIKPINKLADTALAELKTAINKCTHSVALEKGDMLILRNKTVIHGRNSFKPRYDGTDRWLLRALVVAEKPPDMFMQESVCTYTFEE